MSNPKAVRYVTATPKPPAQVHKCREVIVCIRLGRAMRHAFQRRVRVRMVGRWREEGEPKRGEAVGKIYVGLMCLSYMYSGKKQCPQTVYTTVWFLSTDYGMLKQGSHC